MDYRWTTLMADYILDVCSGAIAGRLCMGDFRWATLYGRL